MPKPEVGEPGTINIVGFSEEQCLTIASVLVGAAAPDGIEARIRWQAESVRLAKTFMEAHDLLTIRAP